MKEILLVEDNEDIAEGLKMSFEGTDMSLKNASDIKEARALIENGSYRLILLDVNLTDGNGFDFYKNYLSDKKIPVIFLTVRDDENDIVKGLEMGGEDYITKPFSVKELMARVKKVLMRTKKAVLLKVKDITFDLNRLEVYKNQERLVLSSLEMKILKLLFEKHNKAVSRDEIIELIWMATGNDVFDHTVTVYIKRIKDKLKTDIISTVKGVGYRIDLEE